MAEMMGPYDPASPCITTFCKRISKEEHEKQASDYTQKALAELIEYLEYNPTAYHNILRKRKREDAENAGVFSWLKVKMLSTMFGDEYPEKLDESEVKGKLSTLKEEIISSYNYAEEAKGSGKRFSRRIANRKKLASEETKMVLHRNVRETDENIIKNLGIELDAANQDVTQCSTPKLPLDKAAMDSHVSIPMPPPPPPLLPPPPPPPPAHSNALNLSNKDKHQPKNLSTLPGNLDQRGPLTRSQVSVNRATRPFSDSAVDELMTVLKNPTTRASLKRVGNSDLSPHQQRQIYMAANKENEFPLFNQQLICKFHNARSPKSPEESQYLSDVSSPDSFANSP